MMKKLFISLLFSIFIVNLYAQKNTNTEMDNENDLFMYNLSENNEKHYFIALTGSLLPSIICYTWNNYFLKAGWAKVDSEEMSSFYNRDLKFDVDWVSTNFIGHPYQGSLYYLSGRSANLNMFESFAISVLGSYVWEFICEANAPSINDMAYTTIGAFALGEMLNKLSHQADNNNYVFHYLLNPISMYSDLFLGKRPVDDDDCIKKLDLWIGLSSNIGRGKTVSDLDISITEKTPFLAKTGINIVYNDPYGHKSKEPYDQFELSITVGVGPGNGITQEKPLEEQISYNTSLFSNGIIKSYSKDISDNNMITYGISFLYDYTWTNFYEFTSLAPAIMFNQKFFNEDFLIGYQIALGFNLLGITEFNYYRRQIFSLPDGQYRSYNYVFGFELYGKFECNINKNHIINYLTHSYLSDNFYDPECDNFTGLSFYSLNQLLYEYGVSNSVFLGIRDNLYLNYSIYNSLPNYFSLQNEIDLYVDWKIK